MEKSIGFWKSWAFVVGTMIGSGIFLLPSVLAPYGSLSLLGWFLTAFGALLIALTLGSLSTRVDKEGGPYAYCHEILGPAVGFFMGWGLWMSFWLAIAASALAFSGYASALLPSLEYNGVLRTSISLLLVWSIAGIFLFGISSVGFFQLLTTILKLIPLLLIPSFGYLYGEQSLGEVLTYDTNTSFLEQVSKVILITMFAFLGIEVATIPAKQTIDPKKTIPRALFFGLLSVSFVYFFATMGIWFSLPADQLASSPSPFADAAKTMLGPVGASLVAIGIMISIIGSINGSMVASVIIPQSMAEDHLFPTLFLDKNKHHTPWKSLMIVVILISAVLILSTSSNLVSFYELLITLATLTAVLPFAACSIAELSLQIKERHLRAIQPVTFLRAVGALIFSFCMIVGGGAESVTYGLIILVVGIPIYFNYRAALNNN